MRICTFRLGNLSNKCFSDRHLLLDQRDRRKNNLKGRKKSGFKFKDKTLWAPEGSDLKSWQDGVVSQTAKARKGCKSRLLIRACLSQVQTQPFFSPFRGNYSGCVAWRQQGPQAQLVCNTTQVAVNPLAPAPAFPPSSPHQWRDRNQTKRNLLKVY